MSWYISLPPIDASLFVAAIEALELHEGNPPATPETLEQFRAAKRAALTLFFSGAVGDYKTGRFQATLSGHSNPGHTRPDGYAQDTITASVSQEYVERPRDAATAGQTYTLTVTG